MNKSCLLSCKASDRHLDYFNCRLHKCKTRLSYLFVNLNEIKKIKFNNGSKFTMKSIIHFFTIATT